MEQAGKGLSNDTIDSRTSNASSRDQEISTGFSATPDHEPLSSLEYSEPGPSQTSLWSLDQRPKTTMTSILQCTDGTADTNFLPLDTVYNNSPLFQFSSTLQKSELWQKPSDDYGIFERDNANSNSMGDPVSPRMMASNLQTYVKTGGSSGTTTHVELSDATPPAEKKMRSTGKHEYPACFQTTPQYNFNAETGTRQPWNMCPEEQVIRPMGMVRGGSAVMGTRELHTMEQLLVQCAVALEASDITQAQQTIFVINNIAAVDGDPNQRLLAYFLKALILRASRFAPHLLAEGGSCLLRTKKLKSVLELTNYIDVMPWYRFGFIAANGAMLEAFEGKEKVHILDFNVSHCMQWPTLIEALAERSEGPPQVRLTVCVSKFPIPPLLEVPYEDLITRLAKFARSKNVPFEYTLLAEDVEDLDTSKIYIREDEALAVNCLFRLRYVSEESFTYAESLSSPRDQVMKLIRNLNPAIVTLIEEDANLTSPKMVSRLRAAFNYLWIPFDALHTLLPKESQQRLIYEDEVAAKIENLVACEGRHRIERLETKDRWVQRMKRARFEMVAFSEDVVAENKLMLGEHSGCWSLRKDEDEDVLFLNWKGHTVSFATAWVPVDIQATHHLQPL